MVRSPEQTVIAEEPAPPPPPPKKKTSLDLTCYPSRGTVPFTVDARGTLWDERGEPVPYKTIWLYVNGELGGLDDTDANGEYEIPYTIIHGGTYGFQTRFEGDEEYEGCKESWRGLVW